MTLAAPQARPAAAATATAATTPITTRSARFTFYDIESLANVFTFCAYTPASHGRDAHLEIMFLLDDEDLVRRIDSRRVEQTILASNPALLAVRPRMTMNLANLNGRNAVEVNRRLARIIGLSDARCDRGGNWLPSRYPQDLALVADTEKGRYDPVEHPFLAGYNSANYDTTMLAWYLYEVFGEHADNAELAHRARAQHRTALDRLRALQRSGDVAAEAVLRARRDVADAEALVQDTLSRTPQQRSISAAAHAGAQRRPVRRPHRLHARVSGLGLRAGSDPSGHVALGAASRCRPASTSCSHGSASSACSGCSVVRSRSPSDSRTTRPSPRSTTSTSCWPTTSRTVWGCRSCSSTRPTPTTSI